MIDWFSAASGVVWITGLALVVTALGFANFQAGQQKCRFEQALDIPAHRTMLDLGLLLFCLGQAVGASDTWVRIAGAGLALVIVVRLWLGRKRITSEAEVSRSEKIP